MIVMFKAVSFLFFLILLGAGVFNSALADGGWKLLPGIPKVCEPSTVVYVPCPGGEKCVLVGDNEHEDKLFLYRIDERQKTLSKVEKISIKAALPKGVSKLEDIEAMAKVSEDKVIVFGSHSRNTKCRIKPLRRQFFEAQFKDGKLIKAGKEVRQAGDGSIRCDDILSRKVGADDPLRLRFCKVLKEREDWAMGSLNNKKTCKARPGFNIEGAVAVRGKAGNQFVWVGLRAPLVDGKAVMLRLTKKRDKFRFIEIVFVDLNRHGIRALERDGDTIRVVSGPEGKRLKTGDDRRKHVLWKFSADKLRHGVEITPEKVQVGLDEYIEGLAVSGKSSVMVIDGEQIKGNEKRCERYGTYKVLEIE